MSSVREKIRVYGIVQGIGFRPFVARLADRLGAAGDVCNKGSYVEIHAEASPDVVASFKKCLVNEAPAVSAIIHMTAEQEPCTGATSFTILKSVHEEGEIYVSPDLAICPDCQRELFDPRDRRYLHPFINCTNCGPRLTILDSMPYDRVRTSMGEFPMCSACEYEYTHASTRRFHAQPVCCNDCGPTLSLYTRSSENAEGPFDLEVSHEDRRAVRRARQILMEGGIVAVKGIGGFHLACDASNEEAVMRLRTLKHRPMKPFAVMMRDLDTVRRECSLLSGEEAILEGVQKPILLLRKVSGREEYSEERGTEHQKKNPKEHPAQHLVEAVAPGGNPNVGVMLPYAPVQLLLFKEPDGLPMTDMLVMTSGNPSGAPICRTTEEALRYLSPMCDAILTNNRRIRLRADDTVMQFVDGKPYMIRRSRGYAPLPFVGPAEWKGEVLGIGGELKNTFCLAKDTLFYPSPYIGDLADFRSVDALKSAISRMETLLEIRPRAVGCDLHPRYNSTAVARELGIPVVAVQHHYAHVLSCMTENQYEEPVIGISFDGTGYGTDGTIWGGEFLISGMTGFVRLGSIEPFLQAGGDLSSKEGWRIAVSLLLREKARELFGKWRAMSESEREELFSAVLPQVQSLGLCDGKMLRMQLLMLTRNINTVTSTSAGRIFDAASAILGIRRASTFEGEASMALEFAADSEAASLTAPVIKEVEVEVAPASGQEAGMAADLRGGSIYGEAEMAAVLRGEPVREEGMGISARRFLVPTDSLVRALLEGREKGTDISALAGGFHTSLAEMILAGARECRRLTGISTAVLTGGCFQNLLLLQKTKRLLEKDGFCVLTHSLVPPNDGGICLGQAVAAMGSISSQERLSQYE